MTPEQMIIVGLLGVIIGLIAGVSLSRPIINQ